MDILEGYADRFQQVSIDEAYLDITSCGGYAAATEIARKIKQDIFRQEHLTCSIGVAPGKSTAKVASDFEKPGGLVVVTPERRGSSSHPCQWRKSRASAQRRQHPSGPWEYGRLAASRKRMCRTDGISGGRRPQSGTSRGGR